MGENSQGYAHDRDLSQVQNNGPGNDHIILDDFHFGGFKMKMGNVQVTGCIGGILYENYFFRFVADLVAGVVPVIGPGDAFYHPAFPRFQVVGHPVARHGIFPFFLDHRLDRSRK